MVMTIEVTANAIDGNFIDVYLINQAKPTAFSDDNPPAVNPSDTTKRPEGYHIFMGRVTMTTGAETLTLTLPADETSKGAHNLAPISREGGKQILDGGASTVDAKPTDTIYGTFGGYNTVVRQGRWEGGLAFYLRCDDKMTVDFSGTTLTTTEVAQFTGLAHTRDGVFERAIKCARCGTPTQEDMLIMDGYKRELKVCSECYDPPQVPGRSMRGYGRGFTG
jgi:hypothetical protein